MKPISGWPTTVIDEFRSRLSTTFLFAKFINYNDVRNLSDVEITEKGSKITLNQDFGTVQRYGFCSFFGQPLYSTERYQIQASLSPLIDPRIYNGNNHDSEDVSNTALLEIPMETLDNSQPSQIRSLYYLSPSFFYVYLQEKLDSYALVSTHTSALSTNSVHHVHLVPSEAPDHHRTRSSGCVTKDVPTSGRARLPRYLAPCHTPWFDTDERLNTSSYEISPSDIISDGSQACVFFIDIGQREFTPIENVHSLPRAFLAQPAMAIPCRLHNIHPLPSPGPPEWKLNDPVHSEFSQLMANTAACQVVKYVDKTCYEVQIELSSK